MTHQAVSTPYPSHQAVGTGGRPLPAHLVAERQPQLGEEARRLLEALPSKIDAPAMLKFAERFLANPSRPGTQAVAYLAWCCREAARKKHPNDDTDEGALAKVLQSRADVCAAVLDYTDASEERDKKILETCKAAITEAYALGFAAGQEELKKQLPSVVRETAFSADKDGRIVSKTEREYRPGGKS